MGLGCRLNEGGQQKSNRGVGVQAYPFQVLSSRSFDGVHVYEDEI